MLVSRSTKSQSIPYTLVVVDIATQVRLKRYGLATNRLQHIETSSSHQ